MNAMRTTPGLAVLHPEMVCIVGALAHRVRYRYVQPVVVPEAGGWTIVSPNCSRNIDPEGGPIAIAWLLRETAAPARAGGPPGEPLWRLHVRDHGLHVWRLKAAGLTLDAALALICTDPSREFWP